MIHHSYVISVTYYLFFFVANSFLNASCWYVAILLELFIIDLPFACTISRLCKASRSVWCPFEVGIVTPFGSSFRLLLQRDMTTGFSFKTYIKV